jgi:uncharacterized membrane protein
MFKNVGKKLKIAAIIINAFIALITTVYAIYLMTYGIYLYGGLVLIGGILVAWVGALLLYGFGDLIENTAKIANSTKADKN